MTPITAEQPGYGSRVFFALRQSRFQEEAFFLGERLDGQVLAFLGILSFARSSAVEAFRGQCHRAGAICHTSRVLCASPRAISLNRHNLATGILQTQT